MPIQDLVRSEVVTADPDTSVADLATTMDDESVGSVVITEGEQPVGIVTDRDLAIRVLGEGRDPDALTASDVMSEDLETADPETGFYEATETMADNGIRRLPVTDADDTLVGIITADDLTELLAEEQQHLGAIIEAQRPPY
ncbi:CBS domain-containing protein [Natronomonas sp.]|uniref:CBS domain-containing protein n=1 Tax=Natronomonas sp. TaxID=2184060 RepID=UPI002FC2E804